MKISYNARYALARLLRRGFSILGLYFAFRAIGEIAGADIRILRMLGVVEEREVDGSYLTLFIILGLVFMLVLPLVCDRILTLRDKVEYDDFGNSKKHGDFRKLSDEQRAAIDLANTARLESLLPTVKLNSMTKTGPKNPEQLLASLIGLGSVKETVEKLSAELEFDKLQRRKEKAPFHMCFYGPPGTGKTTVARIITGLLFKYGKIAKNRYIEADGNQFAGLSPSDSNMITQRLLQKAMGGVLFIDEAYALCGSGRNTEVIATLLRYMEDYSQDLVIIFAGYENEIRALIGSNPGFASRIRRYIQFPSFTETELCEIFEDMAYGRGYEVSPQALIKARTVLEKEMYSPSFGNARTVRNCVDDSILEHKSNYVRRVIPAESKKILEPEDITLNKNIFEQKAGWT